MLIEFKINLKLSIICFVVFFRRNEKFLNVILGEQRTAQDSHDLHNGATDFEVVLNNTDETVRDDGDMYLDTYGIFACSPERLDFKVLLNPFKEQLDLPSVFVKKSDILCLNVEVVRVVSERPEQFWSVIYDTSNLAWIFFLVLFLRENNSLVAQDVVRSVKHVFSTDDFKCRHLLLSNNKEGSRFSYSVKSGKVKVASIKDIASQWLVCEPVHEIHIMHIGIGDSVEHRYLRNDIHLSMNLDTRLRASELCPAKDRHTEIDSCGVHSIESAMQLKLSRNSSLLRKNHHVECELFKDTIISEVVRLGECALVNGSLSESEMKRLLAMSSCDIREFPQPLAPHKLSEHKNKQLTPMGWSPILGPVTGLGYKSLEIPFGKETSHLSKNVLSEMHICHKFDLGAKISISKVRQGFRTYLYCK